MKKLRITVEDKTYDVQVEMLDEGTSPQTVRTETPVVSAAAAAAPVAAPAAAPVAAEGDITSPLAGVVQAVEVEAGASVKAGDLIVTLEAMKMFTEINAPADGTIGAVHVKPGDAVDEGAPLYSFS
ncbi:MAG: acetyl-CoA carboxylase biotin carboxyl carrier protein subunit [Verrucomicrobiae bacterium]|nr:acetyl-CoA carboxylase biotin carboxyl carrier protein subunit [Verrucomicrobiae bacterium]NNJ42858.1 acetyl-CoA carboxylase biotin carboxyl carrier protein subunit [Akkermansiaceae bacterium]